MSLTNAQIAELLAIESERATGQRQKAFRRASRRAFLWQDEVVEMATSGRSLRELEGIGPFLSVTLHQWLDDPPQVPEPPDLRRDFLTWSEASDVLEAEPGWGSDARGDLQMHTTWSDGYGSLDDMRQAADEQGYEYIAITDHSVGLRIAGGMPVETMHEQQQRIDSLNAEGHRVRVLKSIEMNLSPVGEGDLDSAELSGTDLVLGSFHSSLRKKEDQTERYVAALHNPDVQILGHPRGRIYNFRVGLSADWSRVFDVAAERGKAVEIDSFPDRQDLNRELLVMAARSNVFISIGTDAHHPSQLHFLRFGLAAALHSGIAKDRILNFMPLQDLLRWASELRDRYSPSRVASP